MVENNNCRPLSNSGLKIADDDDDNNNNDILNKICNIKSMFCTQYKVMDESKELEDQSNLIKFLSSFTVDFYIK